MKIIEFGVGKKYRHRDWSVDRYVAYRTVDGRTFLTVFFNDGRIIKDLLVEKDYINSNHFFEVKLKKDIIEEALFLLESCLVSPSDIAYRGKLYDEVKSFITINKEIK